MSMRIMGGILAILLAANVLRAQDTLSELEARVAALEKHSNTTESMAKTPLPAVEAGCDDCGAAAAADCDCAPVGQSDPCANCAPDDPCGGADDKLCSLRRRAVVRVGGEIKVDTVYLRRTDTPSESDDVDSTRFSTGEPYGAYLDMLVQSNPDAYLYLRLDLDDAWDETLQQDDFIEEIYFRWNRLRCSNWDVVFGKKPVDYGMNKTLGITPSFHDGWAYWLSGLEEIDDPVANPHNAVGTNNFPTAHRHVYQAEAIYTMQEMAKFYFTVFQNNETTGRGRITRGMHEDRSDDHFGFQSLAVKGEYMPAEGLLIQAGLMNAHIDSAGDEDIFGKGAREDKLAASIGFDYKIPCKPLEIFGEYQHGWNWLYQDNVDANIAQLGAIWGVTEAIGLGIMGEWAQMRDAIVEGEDEDYWQVVFNSTYHFPNGMYLMGEYAHVWYDGELNGGDDRGADMWGFRTGWKF